MKQHSVDLAAAQNERPAEHTASVAPAEHTPLPWEWWTSNSHARLTSAVTRSDGDVLSAYVARDGHPCINVREINMEYIVHACNAYPRLVAILLDGVRHGFNSLDAARLLRELDEIHHSGNWSSQSPVRTTKSTAAYPKLVKSLSALVEWHQRDEAGALDPEWDFHTMALNPAIKALRELGELK